MTKITLRKFEFLGRKLEFLSAYSGEEAKILAGGQSLVPLMNFRLARPSNLIDINRVDSLAYLRKENGALRIGEHDDHG